MNTADIKVGRRLEWHRAVSNYGHVEVIHVTVLRVGKRITVEVPLPDGGARKLAVYAENLWPIEQGAKP